MFYCYYQGIADKQIILILRIKNIHLLIIMIILGNNFLYNNILLVKLFLEINENPQTNSLF